MRARAAAILVLVSFGFTLPAHADMIEIKGRGVLNGKVLSQDDREVRFEDSAKNVFVAPRSEVLFLELQKDVPAVVPEKKQAGGWAMPDLRGWRNQAGRYFEVAKRFATDKTRGIAGFIKAPLDRSSADSKSKALADSMGELSGHMKSLNKQDRKRGAQMRGIKEDQAKSKGKAKKKTGGNFSSLD